MKKLLALTTAMLLLLSLAVMAEVTSAPVPIHRTTAKHHSAKPIKHSAMPSQQAASSAH